MPALRVMASCFALWWLLCHGEAFVSRARPRRMLYPSLRVEAVSTQEASGHRSELLTKVLSGALSLRGGAGNVKQIATQAELEDAIARSGDALVCVDFTATWCSPCQQIAPAFEQLSQELTDVVFLKVDVDENEETAQEYDVVQMPTFLFMRRGEIVDQFSGANAAVLRQKIEALLGAGATAPTRSDEAVDREQGPALEGSDRVSEEAGQEAEGGPSDAQGGGGVHRPGAGQLEEDCANLQ